jgi:type II secretory pathway component PulK
MPTKQQGIALISVLITMSIIATLSASLMYSHHIDIERTGKLTQHTQIWALVFGLESMASSALKLDGKLTKYDGLTDKWAELNNKQMPIIGMEGAFFSIALSDLQGAFNLNNLSDANKNKLVAQKQLKHLLTALVNEKAEPEDPDAPDAPDQSQDYQEFDVEAARDSIVDWIDANSDRSDKGAEDDEYYSSVPAYLTANGPMAVATELAVVVSFTDETGKSLLPKLIESKNVPSVDKQQDNTQEMQQDSTDEKKPVEVTTPHIVALPIYTKLNVNTANSEVLQALLDAVKDTSAAKNKKNTANVLTVSGAATKIIQDRQSSSEQAFKDEDDFYDAVIQAAKGSNNTKDFWKKNLKDLIDIKSDFFLLTSSIELGELKIAVNSILHRTDKTVEVVQRLVQ